MENDHHRTERGGVIEQGPQQQIVVRVFPKVGGREGFTVEHQSGDPRAVTVAKGEGAGLWSAGAFPEEVCGSDRGRPRKFAGNFQVSDEATTQKPGQGFTLQGRFVLDLGEVLPGGDREATGCGQGRLPGFAGIFVQFGVVDLGLTLKG
jgi:hypothetical protein